MMTISKCALLPEKIITLKDRITLYVYFTNDSLDSELRNTNE